MTAVDSHWERLEALFRAAAALPRAEWRSFLLARCGADDGMVAEVMSMLDRLDREPPDTILARAQRGMEQAAAQQPVRIGPYSLLEELGHGGQGLVYKGEQREPFRRFVALKVIKAGLATKDVLARFQLERKALAAMSHRCIAKVFDAGATDKGEPYFVMEYVEGLPLTA